MSRFRRAGGAASLTARILNPDSAAEDPPGQNGRDADSVTLRFGYKTAGNLVKIAADRGVNGCHISVEMALRQTNGVSHFGPLGNDEPLTSILVVSDATIRRMAIVWHQRSLP